MLYGARTMTGNQNRLREGTYGVRRAFNWRISPEFHSSVTAEAERLQITTTALVTQVVKRVVPGGVDRERFAKFEDQTLQGRVTLTLRIDPILREQMTTAARRAGGSVNRFVSFAVSEALKRGTRHRTAT